MAGISTGAVIRLVAGSFGVSNAPFVAAIWGQSEDNRTIDPTYDSLTPEALVAEGLVTFWWHDRVTSGAGGVQSLTLTADAIANDSRVTAGMVAMANTFMRNATGRAIKLIFHTEGGTDPRAIMDETWEFADRVWEDDWALHAAATADGYLPTIAFHSWFAKPVDTNPHYDDMMAAFLWGRDINNNLLTYSEGSPLTIAGGVTVKRTLRDLYTTNPPLWCKMTGHHTFMPTADMSNSKTTAGGSAVTFLTRHEENGLQWRALVDDTNLAEHFAAPRLFQLGAYANGFDNAGTWDDPRHPSGETDEGTNFRSRQVAHAISLAGGFTSWTPPQFDNSFFATDGSYAEFGSSAGAITNLRKEATGDPDPGSDEPHWSHILGFEIDGDPAERAEIQSNGRVRVYPNSGSFTNSTVFAFGAGGSSGTLLVQEDGFGSMWQNYPIVDVGLPDVPGMPVQPMPAASVLQPSGIVVTAPNLLDGGTWVANSNTTVTDNGDGTIAVRRTSGSGTIRAAIPIDTSTHGTALSASIVLAELGASVPTNCVLSAADSIDQNNPEATLGTAGNATGTDGTEIVNVVDFDYTAGDGTTAYLMVRMTNVPASQGLTIKSASVTVQ